ncbi:hypothetical protein JCM3765_003302 [Sporobolomyces pararoseus]
MSHLPDAPILKTRHQLQRSKISHQLDPLFDANSLPLDSSSSSNSSPSRRYQPYQPRPVVLRTLRLPQIAKRHANTRTDGPQFYNFLPKRAPVDLGGDIVDVDENTNCRDVVESYEGDLPLGQVRRRCGVAAVGARRAVQTTKTTTTLGSAESSSSKQSETSTTTVQQSELRTTTRARRIPAQSPQIAAVSLTANRSNSAALESNVNQIFSEAASIISSRSSSRAALASSVESLFSSAASAVSSRRVAATATSTPAPSTGSTSSSTISSSTAPTSRQTSSAPTSSSSPSPASSGSSHRIRNIVVPSVVIPIGLLLLFLLGLFCWKKRKRRDRANSGREGLGPISGPRPLKLAAGGNYGTTGGARGAGIAGVGAGAMATAAARGGGRNGSNETLETTPSAIGVAVSEPRTKWGRRSLVEALAGGVLGSNSSSTPSPVPSRGGGAMHSRQESLTSSLDRGTGGYNSKGGYRPGMPRPFSPVQTSDSFPSIIPVPPANQRPSSLSSNSDDSLYNRSHETSESATARLAQPIPAGYSVYESSTTPGVESQASEQGYWTADAGANSSREAGVDDAYRFGGRLGRGDDDDEEEELSPGEMGVAEAPVNFGSSSSNSSSSGGGSTPVVGGSGSGTPRLGSGHGSRGYRRGDSSWWN